MTALHTCECYRQLAGPDGWASADLLESAYRICDQHKAANHTKEQTIIMTIRLQVKVNKARNISNRLIMRRNYTQKKRTNNLYK